VSNDAESRPSAILSPWWRFDGYEIRDGYMKPSQGARLIKYDALAAGQEPLDELFKLIGAVVVRNEGPWNEGLVLSPLPRKMLAGLLDWCSRWGLLGLAVHRFDILEGPWERYSKWSRNEWHRDIFARSGCRWDSTTDEAPPGTLPSAPRVFERYSAGRKEGLPNRWRLADEAWLRYFPGLSLENACGLCPAATEEWWRAYSEPIDEIIDAAAALDWAMRRVRLTMHPEAETPRPLRDLDGQNVEDDRPLANQAGWQEFSDLLAPVSFDLVATGEGLRRTVRSPSLLGYLVELATRALMGGARVIACKTCGAVVLRTDSRALYCSEACRHRFERRRQRERKRNGQ